MQATITASGDGLRARIDGGGAAAEWTAAADAAQALLQQWCQRYDQAAARDDDSELLAIGREMARWLDGSGWLRAWLSENGAHRLILQAPDASHRLGRLLHDAPWELLADPGAEPVHLAADVTQPFEVARRIGPPAAARKPQYRDLCLLFLAAAPAGQKALDFEAEEASILEATARLQQLHLTVEESGSLDGLALRLGAGEDALPEIVHLTCHGAEAANGEPVLLFEDARGEQHEVSAGELARTLAAADADGGKVVRLVVLSACGTAAWTSTDLGRRTSLVSELIRSGIDQVLGWDGSVNDQDATRFAEAFYQGVAGRRDMVAAAALARQKLFAEHQEAPALGQHWHMARVYLGKHGGHPLLLATGGNKRRLRSEAGQDQFLDRERASVPVAARSRFVGRRREIQKVLRAFQDGRPVLVHGMGHLGKSSLAARIAHDRLPQLRCVVVFGRYDPLEVWDRLLVACPAGQRDEYQERWRDRIEADRSGAFANALEDLLNGPLADAPVLLVIDDLERILETPQPNQTSVPVKTERRSMLSAVLTAFGKQDQSRLLLTSRYTFTLPDSRGRDLAADLVLVPLRTMDDTDRRKQQRALLRELPAQGFERVDLGLLQRACTLAGGNPGLQALLSKTVLAGETDAAQRVFAVIEHYLQHGVPPDEIRRELATGHAADEHNALLAFFRRMAFDTYRNALNSRQLRALQAGCLFASGVPVPLPALQAAAHAAGVHDAAAAVRRLLGLGLLDDHGELGGVAHAAVNPLAGPLVDAIPNDDARRWATAALPALADAWIDGDRFRWPAAFAAEAWRLIRRAEPPAPARLIDTSAAVLARHRYERGDHARAILDEVVLPAYEALAAQSHAASGYFWNAVHDVADRDGNIHLRRASLEKLHTMAASPFERGSALLRAATAAKSTGNLEHAKACLAQAAELFCSAGANREVAIARGGQADILQARAQFDEALRIRQQEVLPVFEKLGDVRLKAVTHGQIADILQARGQFNEALRTFRQEVLPVFQQLDDVHSKAATLDRIADILQARGQLEEAQRIRQHEVLPTFEQIGAVREKGITQGKITDILQERGQVDEALRILREEQLPIYEQLGDMREKAVTQGRIADILLRRLGQFDEALRILRQEVLPVFEQLGDVRSKVVALGKVADILQTRGQVDEALRILREEELPVYEQLGDVRSKAITLCRVACLRLARNEQETQGGLLAIFESLQEASDIAMRMGTPDLIIAVGLLLAQTLDMRQEFGPALAVLRQVEDACVVLGDETRRQLAAALRQQIEAQRNPPR